MDKPNFSILFYIIECLKLKRKVLQTLKCLKVTVYFLILTCILRRDFMRNKIEDRSMKD